MINLGSVLLFVVERSIEYQTYCREWPLPEQPKKVTKYGFGLKRKPKGHKFEKKNEQR